MMFAMFILAALVLFMLAGTLLFAGRDPAVVFHSPLFIILAGLLFVSLVWACARRRSTGRQAAFILTHGAIVLILLGAALGFWFGEKSDLVVPVKPDHIIRNVPGKNLASIPLGFGLGVPAFRVEYYDKKRMMPSHFEADLRIEDGNISEIRVLRVNHPVSYRGWRIYLMSWENDPTAGEVLTPTGVVLTARRDPGRGLVIAGIWMLMIGVTLTCLWKGAADEH